MNKKGQALSTLSGIAVGLLVFSITIIVAFVVMSSTKDNQIDTIASTSYSAVSKAITVDSFTGFPECIDEENIAVSELFNDTGPGRASLLAGNYTISFNTINVSDNALGSGVIAVDSTINMTYSCRGADAGYNGTESLQRATDSVPTFIPIVIIAMIGAVLIGLAQRFRRR